MTRTPSPLNWLASGHSHLIGRIERLKQIQAKLEVQVSGHQAASIATVRRLVLVEAKFHEFSQHADSNGDLASIHPVPFNLDVAPTRPHHNPYLLPRGGMTETILITITRYGGTAATDQILEQFMQASGSASANRSYVKMRLLTRLWRMAKAGKLRPSGSTPRTRNRSWHLSGTQSISAAKEARWVLPRFHGRLG